MATKEPKNWIDAMIEREAIPKGAREQSVADFCNEWDIAESTYNYQKNKKENQKKVIDIWLSEAVQGGNEVLAKLKENAKEGKEKSIELYLKFVLELKDRMDITTKDKALDDNDGNIDTDAIAIEVSKKLREAKTK